LRASTETESARRRPDGGEEARQRYRLTLRLAHGELRIRIVMTNLLFDLVKLLGRGERQRRAFVASIEGLHVIPSPVHVAATLDQLGVALEARVEHVRRISDGVALP
jgi:hypothetical protein